MNFADSTTKCIDKYVTSHAKTFLTVSTRTVERTASELGCKQAPSEGGKKIRWEPKKTIRRAKRAVKRLNKNSANCAPPRHHSALGYISPLALDHTWLARTKPINPTGSLFAGYK